MISSAYNLPRATPERNPFVAFYLIILYLNPVMAENITELVENFALFDDWEERYRYLIDLGRAIPELSEDMKTDEALVKGCTSRVWLHPRIENGILHFEADSDAHIVRGLVALLMSAYQDQPITAIKDIDIETSFKAIGLDKHLSPNRRSGFYAMVEKIQSLAA